MEIVCFYIKQVGKRVVMFSYGSGLASSMFSLHVTSAGTRNIQEKMNVAARLDARIKICPSEYDDIMTLREKTHNMRDYKPTGEVVDDAGTWYLDAVDDKFRRVYSIV